MKNKYLKSRDIMAQSKNVTFADIAKYTNFSKTTISRYFNDPNSLTVENQAIISDALEKLNYKENKVARILASVKQNLSASSSPICFCTTIRRY